MERKNIDTAEIADERNRHHADDSNGLGCELIPNMPDISDIPPHELPEDLGKIQKSNSIENAKQVTSSSSDMSDDESKTDSGADDDFKDIDDSLFTDIESYISSITSFQQTLPNNPTTDEEIKVEEIKVEQIKVEETKAEEIKVEEIKVEETKAEEIKVEETKAEEIKVEEIKVEETKAEEIKVEEIKVEQIKVEEIKVEQIKVEEIEVEEMLVEDNKVEEIKVEQIKVEEIEVEEIKVEQIKVEDIEVKEIKVKQIKVEEIEVEEIKVEQIKVEEIEVEEMQVEDIKVEQNDDDFDSEIIYCFSEEERSSKSPEATKLQLMHDVLEAPLQPIIHSNLGPIQNQSERVRYHPYRKKEVKISPQKSLEYLKELNTQCTVSNTATESNAELKQYIPVKKELLMSPDNKINSAQMSQHDTTNDS